MIIDVKNVSKSFGNNSVINNISFQLKHGESMVLLGLNGAGKTTTISMLLGLLKPSSGQISVMHQQAGSYDYKQKISCLPQSSTFPSQLKVKEVLEFMRAHYSRLNENIVEIFNLQSLLNMPLKNLSGGQKRRVSLACAFIGKPELVFLDEPTAGVDISQKKVIWNFLKDYQQNEGSLFLTTHDLMEAEVLAQNILFLHKGQIVEQGTKQSLKKKFSLKKLRFQSDLNEITIEGNKHTKITDQYFEVSTENEISFLSELFSTYKNNISDLCISEMSLMEVVDSIEEQK